MEVKATSVLVEARLGQVAQGFEEHTELERDWQKAWPKLWVERVRSLRSRSKEGAYGSSWQAGQVEGSPLHVAGLGDGALEGPDESRRQTGVRPVARRGRRGMAMLLVVALE